MDPMIAIMQTLHLYDFDNMVAKFCQQIVTKLLKCSNNKYLSFMQIIEKGKENLIVKSHHLKKFIFWKYFVRFFRINYIIGI